jgi:hypothetical protein
VDERSGPDATGDATTDDGATDDAAADAVEDDHAADDASAGADPLRFDRWRKRSATGAVLTGVALGLQQALDRPRQEPAIVVEAPGEPEDDGSPFVVHLDPDHPEGTVAIVRTPPPEPDRPTTDS